jgi:hypothetical protein
MLSAFLFTPLFGMLQGNVCRCADNSIKEAFIGKTYLTNNNTKSMLLNG